MVAGGSLYDGKRYLTRAPRVCFSSDGAEWTAPQKVLAEDHWIRMESADGYYDVIRATVQIAEPIWSDQTFEELLSLAYRDDQIIRDEHHPVIGYLMRGEL